MKTKKFVLDIIMTIIIVSLMDVVFTGIKLHELLGIGVFFLFIIHKFFNWDWIKGVTKNLLSKKIKTKIKVMYAVDILLVLSVTFIIISGILISQELFPSLNADNITLWSNLHHFAAYFSLILISVHIGLHWEMIMFGFRKMLSIKKESKVRKTILRVMSFAIAILGIKAFLKPEILNNFTAPFKIDYNEETITENDNTIKDDDSSTITSKEKSTVQNDDNEVITDNSDTTSTNVSLEEYLSNLVCGGCGRRCPLTALRCSRGQRYKNEAVADYNELYSQTSSTKKSADEVGTDGETSSNDSKIPEMVFLMGLVIGATHYTVTIPKKVIKKIAK